MTQREYVSRVVDVVKVTDGDTYWFRCSVPFRHVALAEIRLLGYDTPEKRKGSPYERAEGKRAEEFARRELAAYMEAPGAVYVRTEPDPDDFGRWLGDVWYEALDGAETHLGDMLRRARLASVWPQRWREEFDPKEAA